MPFNPEPNEFQRKIRPHDSNPEVKQALEYFYASARINDQIRDFKFNASRRAEVADAESLSSRLLDAVAEMRGQRGVRNVLDSFYAKIKTDKNSQNSLPYDQAKEIAAIYEQRGWANHAKNIRECGMTSAATKSIYQEEFEEQLVNDKERVLEIIERIENSLQNQSDILDLSQLSLPEIPKRLPL